MGDSVQTLKAGSLEIGDVVAVTKADRPEANQLARDLRRLQTLTFDGQPAASGWQAPVVKTSAIKQTGIDELVEAVERHRAWLAESGELEVRRRQIAATQLAERIRHDLISQVTQPTTTGLFTTMVDEILDRAITPQRASQLLLALLQHERARSSLATSARSPGAQPRSCGGCVFGEGVQPPGSTREHRELVSWKLSLLFYLASSVPNLTVMEEGVVSVRKNSRNRKPPERRGLFSAETGILAPQEFVLRGHRTVECAVPIYRTQRVAKNTPFSVLRCPK
jgi:hypothetical protein